MARPASGIVTTDKSGYAIARVTLGKGAARISVRLHRKPDADGVCEVCVVHVVEHARELFARAALTRDEIRDALSTACAKAIVCRTVAQMQAYWVGVRARDIVVRSARASTVLTFQEVGAMWLDGKIKAQHLGVAMRGAVGVRQARAKLRKYAYPLIGHIPVDQIESKHLAMVFGSPEACARMSEATRVNLWDICRRVVSLAHEPLKLIPSTPVTKHDRPTATGRRHAALEPQDDADLMRCTAVHIHDRMWWGFLAREGTRVRELATLKWSALSSTSDILTIWMHKTKKQGKWTLNPDTAAALRAYRIMCGNPPGDTYMFRPSAAASGQAMAYRRGLEAAGVRARRPELWEHDDTTGRVRAHDLRALMVTMALAAGKPDSHIRERTGHKSERMIGLYDRDAELYRANGLVSLVSMVEAVPELAAIARGEHVELPIVRDRLGRIRNRPGVGQSRTAAARKGYDQKLRARERSGVYTASRDPATRRAQYRTVKPNKAKPDIAIADLVVVTDTCNHAIE